MTAHPSRSIDANRSFDPLATRLAGPPPEMTGRGRRDAKALARWEARGINRVTALIFSVPVAILALLWLR